MTGADEIMNPQHFGSDPADIRICSEYGCRTKITGGVLPRWCCVREGVTLLARGPAVLPGEFLGILQKY